MKKTCDTDELIAELNAHLEFEHEAATETSMPQYPRCFGHYSDDSPKCDKCIDDLEGLIPDRCMHYTMYLEDMKGSEAANECAHTIDALIERKVNDAIEQALFGLAGSLKFDSDTGETIGAIRSRARLE